jgi:histidine ammonia-lyase
MTTFAIPAPQTVEVGLDPLDPAAVIAVARSGATVAITEAAVEAVRASREQVEHLARSEDPVYGVSTGFGALATRHIAPDMRAALQRSLIPRTPRRPARRSSGRSSAR